MCRKQMGVIILFRLHSVPMLLSVAEDYVVPGTQQADTSVLQETQAAASGDLLTVLSILVFAVVLFVAFLYMLISRRKNKDAAETIFLANKQKASFGRILSIYNTLDNFPLTKKYVNRLKKQFEIIMPGDARYAKEQAVKIALSIYGISAVIVVALFFFHPSVHVIMCVILTLYVGASEYIIKIVEKNEIKLLEQFQLFLSRFRYHYLVDNTVDDAIYDAIGEVPYLMQLHAKKILDVLLADVDKQDEMLLAFQNSTPNRFLKQFMVICMTTMQNGDLKIKNQSLCLSNIKDLKVDIDIEFRKRVAISYKFSGLVPVCVAPVYALTAIQNWAVSNMSNLQSFYFGMPGALMQIACVVVTIVCYTLVGQLKETYQAENGAHYILVTLYEFRPIKKFVDNYWNRFYSKKLRIDNILRRTGNIITAEHFLLQQIIFSIIVYILTIIVFIFANHTTKQFVDKDYSAVADGAGSATEEQYLIMMCLAKYYYEDYHAKGLLNEYNAERGTAVTKYSDDVEAWFSEKMMTRFVEGGAIVTEEQAIDMAQQYNQLYSTNTRLYTKIFGTSGEVMLDETSTESKNAFKQLHSVMDEAASEDPLYNTDGLYEHVIENVYSKLKSYDNAYFHWWMLLICTLTCVLAYKAPTWMLKFKESALQERMEDEVIQFQSTIALLIYFDNVNVLTILDWMNSFADIFAPSIARCITAFTMDEEAALQDLYNAEPFEQFQRIVENLMMVDDVGVFQAFNELEATRLSNQEKRNQENEISVNKRARRADKIAMTPLNVVIIGYLVVPIIISAVQQMQNVVSQLQGM